MAGKKGCGGKKGRSGAPTKFDPAKVPLLEKYMKKGATMEEVADFLGVHRSQVYRWAEKDKVFRDVLASAKEEALNNVERSMYQRAIGSKIKATKFFFDRDARRVIEDMTLSAIDAELEGQPDAVILKAKKEALKQLDAEGAGVIRVRHVEVFPPETNAGKFILTNRRPEKWKDRRAVEQSGETIVNHNMNWAETPGCEPLRPFSEIEAEGEKLNTEENAGTEQ